MRMLSLFILAACSAPDDGERHPVVFDVPMDFAPADRAELLQAAAEWNAVTQRPIIFAAGGLWRTRREVPAGGFVGFCFGSARVLLFHPDVTGARLYAVAKHEYGHSLSLGHTPRGVMDPDSEDAEFSVEDIAECRRVEACP